MAVVFLKHLALGGGADSQGLVNEPGAFVVLDVGTDLANVLGLAEVVEVVILRLEVLTEGNEDRFGLLEVLGRGEAGLVESEDDGEVEGVVGGFVDDDELELVHGEVVQVDLVFGGCEQVAELAELGLEGDFVEEFDKVEV